MSKHKVNEDKIRAYTKEYLTNGFNKTKALNIVNPRAKYDSNNSHCSEFHSKVVESGIFNIEKITPDYVLKHIDNILLDTRTHKSEKLRACELLGKFLAIWKDTSINKTEITQKTNELLAKHGLNRILNI